MTVGGTTRVSGFLDGINSGDGSLSVSGTVQVTGNTHDGVSLGGLNTNTVTTVDITGATLSGNGNDGIFVLSDVTTVVTGATISGNQANGVHVAQSQDTIVNGSHFTLIGSTVSTNGILTGAGAPDGRGVWLDPTGKIGAVIQNDHISANVLEGVRG